MSAARLPFVWDYDDWRLVRWSDAPDRDRFIADLTEIGEQLLLVR